jgi:hypothetical protein
MTEQDIEMEEITEEVEDLMDVHLTDDMDQIKCLICESGDQEGLQRLNKGIQSFLEQCQGLGRFNNIKAKYEMNGKFL